MRNVVRNIVLSLFGAIIVSCAHPPVHAPSEGFADVDKWVAVFEDPERDAWQKPDEVVKTLRLRPGDVIADIGAGTGYFTRRFAVAVGDTGRALGLDVEPAMIDHIRAKARENNLKNVEARRVRPDDPGLDFHSIDVAFLCNTYHHIENRVVYLQKVAASLKPGGRIVIVDFFKRPLPVGPPPDHKLSEETVKTEFARAGYRLTRQYTFLPYQYYLEFSL